MRAASTGDRLRRTLIGGIGYRDLRDHSVGVMVSDRLEARTWPSHIVVEDISYNPIAVVQRFEDEPQTDRFERAILVGATARGSRPPGTVTAYRWDGALPGDDIVQAAVAEAVTGVIALDNTLIIGRYFGGLPLDIVVVDVEPEVHEFGEALSARLEETFGDLCELVTRLALDETATASLAHASLGGGYRLAMVRQ